MHSIGCLAILNEVLSFGLALLGQEVSGALPMSKSYSETMMELYWNLKLFEQWFNGVLETKQKTEFEN